MKHLLTTALVASLAFSAAAQAQDEINVVMFGMPYTRGLQKLAGDFEAETGIKANIEVVGQDVFENRITLSFTGRSSDIDVDQLHITDMAWASAWEQTPPTLVLSDAEMEGVTIAELSGVVQSAETAVIMMADTVQPLSIHLTNKGE